MTSTTTSNTTDLFPVPIGLPGPWDSLDLDADARQGLNRLCALLGSAGMLPEFVPAGDPAALLNWDPAAPAQISGAASGDERSSRWRLPQDGAALLRHLLYHRLGAPAGTAAHLALVRLRSIPDSHEIEAGRETEAAAAQISSLARAVSRMQVGTEILVVDAAADRLVSQRARITAQDCSWQSIITETGAETDFPATELFYGIRCAPQWESGTKNSIRILGWPDTPELTVQEAEPGRSLLPVAQTLLTADQLGLSTITDCGTNTRLADQLARAGAKVLVLIENSDEATRARAAGVINRIHRGHGWIYEPAGFGLRRLFGSFWKPGKTAPRILRLPRRTSFLTFSQPAALRSLLSVPANQQRARDWKRGRAC